MFKKICCKIELTAGKSYIAPCGTLTIIKMLGWLIIVAETYEKIAYICEILGYFKSDDKDSKKQDIESRLGEG